MLFSCLIVWSKLINPDFSEQGKGVHVCMMSFIDVCTYLEKGGWLEVYRAFLSAGSSCFVYVSIFFAKLYYSIDIWLSN